MNSLLDSLRKIDKTYYSLPDLQKVTELSLNSLYVTLSRLVQKRALIRLTSGIYILPEKYSQIDVIANTLCLPSYLSFESALSRHGMLSQIPFTVTFATTRRSVRKMLGDTEVEYRSLKKPLFFGYEKRGSLFLALPEKALLDTLYLLTFGKLELKVDDLELRDISKKRAKQFAKGFPQRTRAALSRLLA